VLERGGARSLPPLLITHGTDDQAVPIDMSRHYACTYRAAGGSVELLEFDGLDHAFILAHPRSSAAREMAQAILHFVEDQTRL
jgi:acetyl esterase/lipase